MKNLVLFALFISSYAAADVVKISSRVCGREDIEFRGSGFLYGDRDGDYVVTSEHVLLHSNDGYCHFADGMPAKIVSVDWGYGLALLKLDKRSGRRDLMGPDAILADPKLGRGDYVVTTGFPWASSQLIHDEHPYVLIPKSDRHLFPSIANVVEIEGGHGEFGMSGGPVLDGLTKYVVGILSHQIIELIAGGKSRVGEIGKEKTVVRNQLIFIPSDVVREWIDKRGYHEFVVEPIDQLTAKRRVYTNGLAWEAVGVEQSKTGKGFDGVGGPGGAEGIGGHGGAEGIGGVVGEKESVVIQVRPETVAHDAKFGFAGADKLKAAALVAANGVEIPFFVRRSNGVIFKVRFASLAEFFRLLKIPGLEPIALLHQNGASAEALRSLGKHIVYIAGEIKTTSVPALLHQSRIKLTGQLLASTWAAVREADLQAILQDQTSWNALFRDNYELTEDLYGSMNNAKRTLVKLKL